MVLVNWQSMVFGWPRRMDPRGVNSSSVELSISWLVVRLIARLSESEKEQAMKYVMLIYQGTALERQAALPEEEQK